MDYNTKFVAEALKQVGKPYLWGARGERQWSPSGPILLPELAFDCSGLILHSAWQAGSKDRTMLENAQTLWDALSTPTVASSPHLRLYGKDTEHVTHVALGFYIYGAGGLLVCEAAGGGSQTTTVELARQQGAAVRVGEELRRDYLGARKLPFW